MTIEEIRLQCLEMVFQHGRPALGNSNEINPIVSREKIRELARFFEDYVTNG